MKEVLIAITLIIILTGIILLASGVFRKKGKQVSVDAKMPNPYLDNPEEVKKKYGLPPNENYILPQEFKVGLIWQEKPVFMNNCNPGVLYPINGLGPDYGTKMPSNCPCAEFVQAP
jgi:hypothetical protein